MALLHKLGADVLAANVEARKAFHDLRTNVNELGVRKGETPGKPKSRASKAKQEPKQDTKQEQKQEIKQEQK